MLLSKRKSKTAIGAAGMLLSVFIILHAPCAWSASADAGVASGAGILSADALPADFTGDDPQHVRDALSGKPSPSQPPSITSRLRGFLDRPLQRLRKSTQSASATQTAAQAQANAQADPTFAFVIPASYGVRYQTKKKLLSVNVSLAAPTQPDAILLKETVKGQSGRKLVVAPEAKAKGFVQTFDVIQLGVEGRARTNVRGGAILADFDKTHGDGDFAILLICTLEPPYLIDRVEHNDPTDEEPTDITRRTSTLHGRVDAVWLIDRKTGTIVTKRLNLVK
ncbi:hypothetical protein [Caballeronia sp. GAWG1-1]|uniref:hypothetical protein n=2 Tax=Caballeronia TaxID=1827195 RepID=UPI002029518C